MAIPTASSQASSMGNLTITLPGCVNIQPGNPEPAESEWDGTGGVVAFAGADAPEGWLLCNGAAVSREDYKNLFDVIGTTYGVGNGNTTFNLPDLRGRFPLGPDNMGGTGADRVTAAEADTLGGSSGAETHTLTIAEMPAHKHSLKILQYIAGGTLRSEWVIRGVDNIRGDFQQVNVEDTGGGGAHNNMPPYLSLNYIIKT